MRRNFCGILSFRVWICFTFLLSVTNTDQSLGTLAWIFLAFFCLQKWERTSVLYDVFVSVYWFQAVSLCLPSVTYTDQSPSEHARSIFGAVHIWWSGEELLYTICQPRIDGFKLFHLLVSIANKKYRLYFYLKSLLANATGRMWESGNMKLDTHTFWIIPKQPSKLKFCSVAIWQPTLLV